MASRATTNPYEIRDWAESWGGRPAAVRDTHRGGQTGIIRIMFPNSRRSEHEDLMEISWNEFFDQFEDRGLALVYEDDSRFNKLVSRETWSVASTMTVGAATTAIEIAAGIVTATAIGGTSVVRRLRRARPVRLTSAGGSRRRCDRDATRRSASAAHGRR
jgi:hypothetical protein